MPGLGLGISVGKQRKAGAGYDPLVVAFLAATGINETLIKNALNFRVLAARGKAGAGVEYLSTIYVDRPFVGGTATTHKYDLINLQQCSFFGGFTHDANGVQGNGTDAFCDEGFNSSVLGQNTAGWAGYCNSANATGIGPFLWLQGGGQFEIYLRYTDGNTYTKLNSTIETGTANTDSRGLFLMTRQSSAAYNLFIRGNKSAITAVSVTPTLQFKTWCRFNGTIQDLFSPRRMASQRFFKASLTDAQAAAIQADETTFQTMLGRNV